MFKKILASLAVFASLVVASPLPASATGANIVGNWYLLTWEDNPRLIQVNKTTGAGTLIGTSNLTVPNGMAGFDIDATNGVGIFVNYTRNNPKVYTVNISNGQITEGPATTANNLTALDIGNNGEVWVAADDLNGVQQGFGRLNPSTGAITNLAVPPARIAALATSATGVLYAFDYDNNMYTVNTSTYVFTSVGTLANQDVLAADFAANGDLISMGWDGDLVKVNVSTAVGTPLFTVGISPSVESEAFAVGGPTDGRTLSEAVDSSESLANTGSNLSALGIGLLAVLGGIVMVHLSRRNERLHS